MTKRQFILAATLLALFQYLSLAPLLDELDRYRLGVGI
jgi:hypothetical protein